MAVLPEDPAYRCQPATVQLAASMSVALHDIPAYALAHQYTIVHQVGSTQSGWRLLSGPFEPLRSTHRHPLHNTPPQAWLLVPDTAGTATDTIPALTLHACAGAAAAAICPCAAEEWHHACGAACWLRRRRYASMAHRHTGCVKAPTQAQFVARGTQPLCG
jgi:hypothetical protein